MQDPELPEVTEEELRTELPSILTRVQLMGESFSVTRDGKPLAIITPVPGDDPVSPRTPKDSKLAGV
jgi:antitoxin (DNA-binding transcriptional repressor) of toxin-antitoxin stability system